MSAVAINMGKEIAPVVMDQDENHIIEAVLSGDRDSFAALVRAHQAGVVRYCLLLMRDPMEAEDAAQEVFVKAFRSLNRFRGQSSFFTWLARIAHNHCMDVLRKRTRQKTDSLDAVLEAGGSQAEGKILAEKESLDDDGEMRAALPAILGSMREEHREILTLREVQGLSYASICEQLSCSLDTVKSRLRRARAEFQEKGMRFRKLAGGLR